ncbi:centrosomal protein of 112 kDa-like [Coccinella septempunctata]|uniref:centrosomal protein of 112 kDa-like n=1 Tax=Coccinella septempunctata TaxID=41139 RepID=UPI001D079E0C|nr:centrosomal protein of 112 kDa-like [Coccinella septempunctata]
MDFEEGREADPTNDKLDVEYRQILRIIKPYIQTINNNTYLAQYRIWLEKLSEAKENEKFVRNQYLMELARQIQCKHLATPFTQTPPRGPLPPLRGNQWNFEDVPYEQQLDVSDPYLNKHMMCQQWAEDNENNQSTNKSQWPFHTSIPRPRKLSSNQQLLSPEHQHLKEAQRCVQRTATSVKKISLLKEIDDQCQEKYMEDLARSTAPRSPTRQIRASTPTTESDAKKRQAFPSQNPSLGVIQEDNSDTREDESWCELSDNSSTSLAVLGSGDTEGKDKKKADKTGDRFEKKINTLMIEINGLKRKSEKVNERCEQTVKNVQEHLPSRNLNSSEELRVRKFPEKVFPQDEPDVAEEKDASYMTTDWKKIIESLQVRLSETQQQNKELNSLTSTLHKKIKEMDAAKEQVKQEIKKQVSEQHKKELDTLKNSHAQKLKEMEEAQEKKTKKMEDNFAKEKENLKKESDDKIKELEEKNSVALRGKDKEISRLEDIIQRECTRLVTEITVLRSQIEEASSTNTSNDERILFLQKCITKMDRLFQKSEREYCRQIEKLKQELDNREKAIQIQLQTQKAEVISRCSAEKQSELDLLVQNLESKYTQLLELQQGQIARMREEDDKMINDLKSILDQHNIPY